MIPEQHIDRPDPITYIVHTLFNKHYIPPEPPPPIPYETIKAEKIAKIKAEKKPYVDKRRNRIRPKRVRKYKPRPESQREIYNEKKRLKWAAMTPEEQKAANDKRRANERKYRAKLKAGLKNLKFNN